MRKYIIIILAIISLLPGVALATAISSLGDVIGAGQAIFNSLVLVLLTLALVVFFWGLVKYLMAAGDADKKGDGKNLMIWGVISLFVMISIWGLVNLVAYTFGLSTPNTNKPAATGIVPANLP